MQCFGCGCPRQRTHLSTYLQLHFFLFPGNCFLQVEGKSSIRKKKKRNKTGTQHLCLLYDIVTWKTLITQNPNLPMFLSVWLHLGSVFASFTTESHLLSFSFTWWPILPSQFVPPFIMGSAHSQSHVPSPPFFFKCIWLSQLWHTGSLVAAFGIQFPNQGSNPGTLHWKHRVLTGGPPEKSLPPPS